MLSQAPRRARWTALLLAIYWLLLTTATHLPIPRLPRGMNDKLLHFLAFGGLGFLAAATWAQFRPAGKRNWGGLLTAVAVYGIIDELLQIPVGRSADIADWYADLIGATLGIAVWQFLELVFSKREDSATL